MHSSTSYPQSHLYLIMEIELHPAVSLLLETFNVLVAPRDVEHSSKIQVESETKMSKSQTPGAYS